MTMTHDEMIAVIQAHRDGKAIEAQLLREGGPWQKFTSSLECGWDTWTWRYRIKPEPPKPREWWIVIDGGNIERYHVATLYTCAQTLLPDQQQIHVREVLP